MKFLACAVAINAISFATLDNQFQSDFAMVAAQEGSGVRARWVELPDCNNESGLAPGEVALKNDLSNAIIATCKSYGVSADRWGRLLQGESNPSTVAAQEANRASLKAQWESYGKDQYDPIPVYDPIVREEGASDDYAWPSRYTVGRIAEYEHQVTQQHPGKWIDDAEGGHQLGSVEATRAINPDDQEPVSDAFKHLNSSGFKYSEDEWEDLAPLEQVNTVAPTINNNAKTYPYD